MKVMLPYPVILKILPSHQFFVDFKA